MATAVERWVEEQERLAKPDKVYWMDGSEGEAWRLLEIGMNEEQLNGPVFKMLNQKTWPTGYLHRSHPTDVARVEHLTFICLPNREDAGPNNNWMDPVKAKKILTKLSDGCMAGRTMYVIPYMMGHPDSPYAKACVMITDSTYVAVSMRIMTRVGTRILDKLRNRDDFIKGFHSIGDLTPTAATSPTSPTRAWSGASARATAATPCSARSASPCASPPTSATSRAGSPSTWSSWASRTTAATRPTSRPPCPAPAARRTWP
jgi:GTP-dependent phosphoenolpyruvate carboxykinase